jgi:hypothetical protein
MRPTSSRLTRVVFAVQLAALAVGLSACGGDALSLDPVASAATKTAASGSSRVEFTIALKVPGETINMNGSGLFDYRDPRGSLTYNMQVPGLGDVRMDMRMVGTKMFLRMPRELAGEGLPNGKEWLGFDLGKSLEQAGLGSLDFAQQQDPAQTLQLLRAASADVKKAGAAVVKGVDTTRYVGRMDFRKALDVGLDELGLSAAEREKAQKGMNWMLDQLGAKSVPFEVYVDGDGLLRRMKMDMSMTIEGERLAAAMQMDYFDFGVDVDVQAPPARSVFDVTGQLQP